MAIFKHLSSGSSSSKTLRFDTLFKKHLDYFQMFYTKMSFYFQNRNDKVKSLMMECLNCLSHVLEYAPLDKTVGKPTEEILNYLKLTFVMDPLSTLHCVQALLRCIFATNSANQIIMSNENIPNSSIGKKTCLKNI